MKTLLITTHVPTANTQKLSNACLAGANLAELDISVITKTALETHPEDVLMADGIIIGTTENIGYMGGLTKDFFDRCYYPVLEKKQGLPVACYIRAGLDGTGTTRALESIISGLKWRWIQAPLVCQGDWNEEFIEQVKTLSMTMAVGLDAGMY